MTDQSIRDRLLGGVRVWSGSYGDHEIPAETYALVKRWRKDGRPYINDKGRAELFAWVEQQEAKAREVA